MQINNASYVQISSTQNFSLFSYSTLKKNYSEAPHKNLWYALARRNSANAKGLGNKK